MTVKTYLGGEVERSVSHAMERAQRGAPGMAPRKTHKDHQQGWEREVDKVRRGDTDWGTQSSHTDGWGGDRLRWLKWLAASSARKVGRGQRQVQNHQKVYNKDAPVG